MATILGNLSTACPSVPIAVMEPFNLGQSAHLKAAIAAAATTDAHYIEATNAAGAPFYDLTYVCYVVGSMLELVLVFFV